MTRDHVSEDRSSLAIAIFNVFFFRFGRIDHVKQPSMLCISMELTKYKLYIAKHARGKETIPPVVADAYLFRFLMVFRLIDGRL